MIGAAVATLLAELYADYLAETIREGRSPTPEERNRAIADGSAGMFAAAIPLVFFILAASSALFVREGYIAPTQEWAHLAQPRATRL